MITLPAASQLQLAAEPVSTPCFQQKVAPPVLVDTASTGQTPLAQLQPTCDSPTLTHSPASDSTEDGPE